MAKVAKWMVWTSIILMVIIAAGSGIMLLPQVVSPQIDYTNIYLPEYASIWCGPCESGPKYSENIYVRSSDLSSLSTPLSQDSFYCGVMYLPGTFKECNYNLLGIGGYKTCGENTECPLQESGYLGARYFGTTSGQTGQISFGSRIRGNPATIAGTFRPGTKLQVGADYGSDVVVKLFGQPFCLKKMELGRFTEDNTVEGCSREATYSLGIKDGELTSRSLALRDAKRLSAADSQTIDVVVLGWQLMKNVAVGSDGVPLNVITSDNVYLRENIIEYGNKIEACPIRVASDGTTYADIQRCQINPSYICLPSKSYTKDGKGASCINGKAIVVNEVGAKCQSPLVEYVSGNQKCSYTCEGGVQSEPVCAAIVYSEEVIGPRDVLIKEPEPGLPVWVWIVAVAVIMLMFMMFMMMTMQKQRQPGGGDY